MLDFVNMEEVLFIDVETVPVVENFSNLSAPMQHLWAEKFERFKQRNPERYTQETTEADAFEDEGGIFAEFGKIICISVGYIFKQGDERMFKLKSFFGDNEKELLIEFSKMMEAYFQKSNRNFCGHNIKEFDMPYIARRMIINSVRLPSVLDIAGKKPWEIKFIDTLELWKFGDYKNYTALKVLTTVLDIPSPKDDIDGSEVSRVYYKENNLKRIVTYCEKDVIATAQVLLRFKGEPLIKDANIIHAN